MKSTNSLAVIASLAIATGAITGLTGCDGSKPDQGSQSQSGQNSKYTCSMHSDVILDKPGKCPKCGMALTEKR